MRDDFGTCTQIVQVNLGQIYQGINRRWNPNMCFNFVKCLLDLIKTVCTEEDQLYIVTRTVDSSIIEIQKLPKESDLYEQRYFLRDWYKSEL